MKIFLNLLAGVAGGPVTRAREFLDIFQEKYSDDDSLVVIKEKGFLDEYVSVPGRVVIDVVLGNGKLRLLHRIIWENLMMYKVIDAHKPDVFLTFSHYLPLSYSRETPSVVGVTNLAPFSSKAWIEESLTACLKMWLLKRTILYSCKRAEHILALSETCKKMLIAQGLQGENISIVSNGVNKDWSKNTQSSKALNSINVTKPFLLSVSHVQRYKNFYRLIEAYARMESSIRKSYQLVLVGEPQNHTYFKELQELISRNNLVSDVILIPGMDKEGLRELFQATTLFVYPSLIENCPNTLLEAMMSGAPVAASNLPPMPEFAGKAAIYFDPLDVDSICQTLEEILRQPKKHLEKMKKLSHKQAENYSWEQFVRCVRNICYSIVVT